ncbi:MAG TPA: hypothetical protein VFY40_20445 [Blastocatellia bacterium]|nr:hypothetical protein [Blastocatellia bacterium]
MNKRWWLAADASQFIEKGRHPRLSCLFTELAYRPMVELLSYLRRNGFQARIRSGGATDFLRVLAPQIYGKDVLRLVVSCGFMLAVLIGAASAQQPAPVAPSPQAADPGPGGSGAANGRTASSCVSERERILLERIEGLERRLNEVEARLNATAADGGKAAAPMAYPLQLTTAAPRRNPAQPTSATTLQQQPTQTAQARTTRATRTAPAPYAAWEKDGVKIIPYGIIIANVNYNTSALQPGSFAGFALPDTPTNTPQFNISPGNTYLGVDIKWPKIGKWEINGKVDFDLRGPTPLRINNIFAPLFINIYGEAKTGRYRLLAGQAPDILSPIFSNSLNIYPAGFQPGRLGFFRPQARFETYQPISDDFTFIYQGAIAEAIQTFQVSDEVIGDQAGLPDFQSRLALGYGKPDLQDQYQRRPFEIGVSGHIGKRQGTRLGAIITDRRFTTWSGDIDLSFKIGRKLRFSAEFFSGSVLGDYTAGAFQTFNPARLEAIRAAGAWAQLTYDISDKWQANVAYGRDDPFNRDLAPGQRSLNEMGYGNFFYRITPRLWVAMEFSRWRTNWVGLPAGRAFRVEPAVLFFF